MTSKPTFQDWETRKLIAEVTKIDLESDVLRFDVAAKERDHLSAVSTSTRARVYNFWNTVCDQSAYNALLAINQWARREPGEPITVVINTPGGSVPDGLALFDGLRTLINAGTPINTVGIGMAASMGGILLQAGVHRSMGRNAFLLIHEASFGVGGKMSEVEDRVEFVKRLQGRLLTILADRSTLTEAQIRRRWVKKDWWLSAEEALELGFIDSIQA